MKLLLTAVNAKYIHSNLAVYSLRAYAKKYRSQIELAEYTINHRQEYILSGIYKSRPDILCFSCYIWNLDLVLSVAEEFHKLRPEVPIWMGGPEVSYHAEAFLKEEPAVDLVMMGEGEITFAHFLKALLEGEDLKQVPGLMVRNVRILCRRRAPGRDQSGRKTGNDKRACIFR